MSEEDQKQQQQDIQEKLRILLSQNTKLRQKYLEPPTHLSSFIGADGQHVGFYKHPENKTLFVEIGRLIVKEENNTKKISLNSIPITKGNFKGFIQDPLGLSEILDNSGNSKNININVYKTTGNLDIVPSLKVPSDNDQTVITTTEELSRIKEDNDSTNVTRYFYPVYPKYMPIYYYDDNVNKIQNAYVIGSVSYDSKLKKNNKSLKNPYSCLNPNGSYGRGGRLTPKSFL